MCGVLWSKNGGVSNDHRYQHKLFFNRWFEEGEGADYKYWEETIVRDFKGNVIEILPGDIMQMPNGEMWHLK